MQTFYEDEAITIRPNQDGHLLSDFQHTLGDLLDGLWFERCAAFYRHVDVCDRKFFSPHHGTSPKCANEKTCQPRTVSKALFQLAPPIKPIGQRSCDRSDARRSLARAVFRAAVRRGGKSD